MKKIARTRLVIGITSGSLFIAAAFAKVGYNPDQLSQFKTTGACPGCDLTSVSISSGISTPYNLSGANISNSGITMSNNTLSNYSKIVAIKTSFYYNNYSQADFHGAVLIDADFNHTELTYANFQGANVTGASFSYANLYGSQGIDFSEVSSVCDAIMPDGSTGACK